MPEQATVALHLGAHKTGTSLVQKYLRDRPGDVAALRAAFINRSDTNDLIGWGDRVIDQPDALGAAIETAATDDVALVIASHENSLGRPFITGRPGLYPDARRCAEALRKATSSRPVKIVYHLRSQESFLESYYLQMVHQGYYEPFDEWIATITVDDVSWRPVVSALRDNFDDVTVIDFATIANGQESFLTDFLDVVAPGHGITVSYGAARNLSVSAQGLRIALDVNPLLETADERRAMRKFLQRSFNNSKGDRPVLFAPEAKAEIATRYAGENRDLVDLPGR